MKKIIAITLLTAACSTAVLAQSGGFSDPAGSQTASVQGGFSGPSAGVITVEQAKSLRDDSHVTLRGYIEKHLGGNDYLFRDQTGTITAEIDADKWNGLTVTPQDLIEISGEIDKDSHSIEIEVEQIRKVN